MLYGKTTFYVFSILLIACSYMVVIAQHPVFSLLFLVSSFLFSAFLLFLLECELLALLFIIIYVGAIAVLFLFAVMMLEFKLNNRSKNLMKYTPIGLIIGITLLYPTITSISLGGFVNEEYSESFYLNPYQNWYDLLHSVSDAKMYGEILYSYFVLQILLAGLILLLVLIGVVYLVNQFNVKKKTREQVVFKQLARKSKFLLKINNDEK